MQSHEKGNIKNLAVLSNYSSTSMIEKDSEMDASSEMNTKGILYTLEADTLPELLYQS